MSAFFLISRRKFLALRKSKFLTSGMGFVLLTCLSCACVESKFSSNKQYMSYARSISNGLIQTKEVGLVKYSAMFMPSELKILQNEVEIINENNVDSLVRLYSESISILFTIEPSQDCLVKDLKYYNVTDKEEFNTLQSVLNFGLKQGFSLNVDGYNVTPTLCHLEQDHGYSGKLNYHLVFVMPCHLLVKVVDRNVDVKLTFNDPVFNQEESEFIFNSSQLKAIPKLDI